MTVTTLLHTMLLAAAINSHFAAQAIHMAGTRRAVETACKEPHKPVRLAQVFVLA